MSSRPIPLDLLPDSATVNNDGSLSIGGCSVADLAEQYGTPLFVYDEAHLRARCREAVAAFGVPSFDNIFGTAVASVLWPGHAFSKGPGSIRS